MAEPFDPDAYLAAKPAEKPFDPEAYLAAKPPPAQPQDKSYTGQILPFSVDAAGKGRFDPRAGILGSLFAPVEFVGDVAAGRIPADPNDPRYIGGALNTALTYGPGAVASRAGSPVSPSTEQLYASGERKFQTYRDSGQMYPTADYQVMLRDAARNLRNQGLHEVDGHPSTAYTALQEELARAPNMMPTSRDLDRMREALSARGLRGREAAAAMNARDDLFTYITNNLPPGAADRNVRGAVADYRQAAHSEVLTDALAGRQMLNDAKVQGALSADQTRTEIAKLLKGRNTLRGFSDAEREALQGALDTTPLTRYSQWVGDKLPLVPSLKAAVAAYAGAAPAAAYLNVSPTLAAAATAGATAAVPVGTAARTIANRGARASAQEADEAIRSMSPLFWSQPNMRSAPFSPRDAVVGAILSGAGDIGGEHDKRRARQRPVLEYDPNRL